MAKGAAKARAFRRRFRKLDPKTGETGKKARQKVFTDLQSFVAGLKTREAVEACLATFLDEHAKLEESRSDSLVLAVFQLIVYRLTSLIQDDLLLLQGLRGRLTEDRSKDGLREVFALLPPDRQQELLKRLDDFIAIEERAAHKKKSLIDELRTAYKVRHAGRHPTLHDLYNFEALPPGVAKNRLWAAFDARHGACKTSYGRVLRRFEPKTLDAFFKNRQRFVEFLHKHRGTGLEIYQLWHWMVRKMNVRLDKDDRWKPRVQTVSDRRMNADLYLLFVHVLLVRALADKNFPLNHAGFTPSENRLFYAPLRYEWFKTEYAFAFREGVHNTRRFHRLAQTHLGLYLYGKSLGAHVDLVRQKVAQRISKARAALTPADLAGQIVDFSKGDGPEIYKEVLRIDREIGLREGRFRIYFVASPTEIYIEFLSLRNVLFKVSNGWLYDQLVSESFDLIYEKTKHLETAIPFVFEVLGYLPTLVTGGLYAAAKEVVVDRVIDATIDEFGPSSTGGPDPSSAIGSVIKTLRRKSPPDGAEVARLQKTLGRLGEPKIDPNVADNILSGDFLETGYDAATQTNAFDALTEAERARIARLEARVDELETRTSAIDRERDALFRQRQSRGIDKKGIDAGGDPATSAAHRGTSGNGLHGEANTAARTGTPQPDFEPIPGGQQATHAGTRLTREQEVAVGNLLGRTWDDAAARLPPTTLSPARQALLQRADETARDLMLRLRQHWQVALPSGVPSIEEAARRAFAALPPNSTLSEANQFIRNRLFNNWRNRAMRRVWNDTALREKLAEIGIIIHWRPGRSGRQIGSFRIRGRSVDGRISHINIDIDHALVRHEDAVKDALAQQDFAPLVSTVDAVNMQLLTGRENRIVIERLRRDAVEAWGQRTIGTPRPGDPVFD